MPDIDGWHWQWVGPARTDHKQRRGRLFYDAVRATREFDNLDRIYRLGDTVTVSSEGAEKWVAQIVEMFQAKPNDDDLSEILKCDARRTDSTHTYDLMRCTLRWFYNQNDTAVPRELQQRKDFAPFDDEVYFSDFVEKDGYNDITVIEGLAFLRQTPTSANQFRRQPNDPRYIEGHDCVRIVRAFFDSKSDAGELRQLDRGELSYLLKNPTKDKTLYETARQRMIGRGRLKAPVMKGVGSKKRKRLSMRASDGLNGGEEEDEIQPVGKKARKNKSQSGRDTKLAEQAKRSPNARRRRHIVEDEDEDSAKSNEDDGDGGDGGGGDDGGGDDDDNDDDEYEDNIVLADRAAVERQSLQRATSEVLQLVEELNGNAGLDPFEDEEVLYAGNYNVENEPVKLDGATTAPSRALASRRQAGVAKKRAPVSDPVVIELTSSDDEQTNQVKRREQKVPSKRSGPDLGNSSTTKKSRQPFEPSSRSNKTTLAAKARGGDHQSSIVLKSKGDHSAVSSQHRSDVDPRQKPVADNTAGRANKSRKETPDEAETFSIDGAPEDVHSQLAKITRKRPEGQAPAHGQAATKLAEAGQFTVQEISPSVDIDTTAAPGASVKSTRIEQEREGVTARPDSATPSSRKKDANAQSQTKATTKDLARNDTEENASKHTRVPVATAELENQPAAGAESIGDGGRTREGTGIDYWAETCKVLDTLKAEFESMSEKSQELFSDHIDIVFDLAVAKVTQRELHGNVDADDSRLTTIVEEILNELTKRLSDEASGDIQGVKEVHAA